jgi:Flp pilus assembly protein TadB
MQHNGTKERQEASLVGRLISMETLILLMGILCLIAGIVDGQETSIFWGVIILVGFVVLRMVRRKDWARHWAEMEAEQKARAAYKKRPDPPADPPEKG